MTAIELQGNVTLDELDRSLVHLRERWQRVHPRSIAAECREHRSVEEGQIRWHIKRLSGGRKGLESLAHLSLDGAAFLL